MPLENDLSEKIMKRFLAGFVSLAAVSTPVLAQPAATPAATAAAAGVETAAPNQALAPTKMWFAPSQPIEIKVAADGPVTLSLTDFTGTKVDPKDSADVSGPATKDVRKIFPPLEAAGTYILYAVPKGKELTQFVGTPLVIEVRGDRRQQGPPGPMVVKVEPLRYLAMTTSKGPVTMAFYYDVAPNTVTNFLTLSAQGYYNGLTFHRIKPGFVIQGGDPRGDGMGGPGYQIDAEFNDRPHLPGVLSMARSQDPNSAGSQFFVCLDYKETAQLDRKYTAYGRVVTGMEAVKAVAAVPTNPETDRPLQPVTIDKAEVKDVTATDNPYTQLQKMLQAK
jgi:cyclophilin family peptidyl-prolyl cis-trans isomerase